MFGKKSQGYDILVDRVCDKYVLRQRVLFGNFYTGYLSVGGNGVVITIKDIGDAWVFEDPICAHNFKARLEHEEPKYRYDLVKVIILVKVISHVKAS